MSTALLLITIIIFSFSGPVSGMYTKTPYDMHYFSSQLNFRRYRSYVLSSETYSSPSDFGLAFENFTEARVDHFPAERTTSGLFSQRFLASSAFWGGPSYPIFFLIGGEGEIVVDDITRGFMTECARTHRAMQVTLEHRYYGTSIPSTNHKFLSVAQVLADISLFMEYFSSKMNSSNSPYVLFGGSYSGVLSAWHHATFPTMSLGAIASSAPIHVTLDFPSAWSIVEASLRIHGGNACVQRIGSAIQHVQQLMISDMGQINSAFRVCSGTLSSTLDFASFQFYLIDPIWKLAQYNIDWYSPRSVSSFCTSALLNTDDIGLLKTLTSFSEWEHQLPPGQCADWSYSFFVSHMQSVRSRTPWSALYAWMYQTCTEFGYFSSASQSTSIFSAFRYASASLEQNLCVDVFGYTPAVQNLVQQFGNLNYTNVLFLNGNLDPWSVLGLQDGLGAVVIELGSHCSDMNPRHYSDSHSLQLARSEITASLVRWLPSINSSRPNPSPSDRFSYNVVIIGGILAAFILGCAFLYNRYFSAPSSLTSYSTVPVSQEQIEMSVENTNSVPSEPSVLVDVVDIVSKEEQLTGSN